MDRINLKFWFQFGWALSELQGLAFSEYPLANYRWAGLDRAIDWLKSFIEIAPNQYPLAKSQAAARELLETLQPFVQIRTEPDAKPELKPIWDGIHRFTDALRFDMDECHVYMVAEVGAYSVPMLLENADAHLSAPAVKRSLRKREQIFNMQGIA